MQTLKHFFSILVILFGLIFLFGPEAFPENFQIQEILNRAENKDVIIIFNSGGWGDTPLEKAKDLAPLVEGIQQTLNEWGYNSVVIPYVRTKDDLFGRITGAKEFFNYFKNSSEDLADEIEHLAETFPDKKIIITGLSNGAVFANKTYEKISENVKNSVYVITAGNPFWENIPQSDNLLFLDNKGKDTLSAGDVKSLLTTFVGTPFKWLFAKITGENLKISEVSHASGHDYPWEAPEINSQIISFLKNKFKN
jgi:hypothetical protein